MLVGKSVAVRTARETDLAGPHDLIADVRMVGDHGPLTIGSKCGWITPFRNNGWWTDDFGRRLMTDRAGERLRCVDCYRASTATLDSRSAVESSGPKSGARRL